MTKVFRLLAGLVVALVVTSGQAAAGPLVGEQIVHSTHDDRCLDVYAGGAGPWVQLWTCTGKANQEFYFVRYPDGTAEFRTSDYWCVDGRWGRGASLERSPCTGHSGQRWRLENPTYPGPFLVRSVMHPSLVWDVHGHGSGTTVQLWDYIGGRHQLWRMNGA